MAWTVEFLNDDVRAALDALPDDIGAAFLRISQMIQSHGLERVREGQDGIARAAYITATSRRVVVVHVFPKKTQKTPRREIEIALKRAKEFSR
jgi:phage-related protein